MRGGLERWKRGVGSRGVGQAIDYALKGTCDAHLHPTTGSDALEMYSAAADASVTRFVVADGTIVADELTSGALRMWVTGHDPVTGEERGVQRLTADADLLLDATVNHPKSYSIAALLHPELAVEFEALQDRLRDRILLTWLRELNARRGHSGLIREDLAASRSSSCSTAALARWIRMHTATFRSASRRRMHARGPAFAR